MKPVNKLYNKQADSKLSYQQTMMMKILTPKKQSNFLDQGSSSQTIKKQQKQLDCQRQNDNHHLPVNNLDKSLEQDQFSKSKINSNADETEKFTQQKYKKEKKARIVKKKKNLLTKIPAKLLVIFVLLCLLGKILPVLNQPDEEDDKQFTLLIKSICFFVGSFSLDLLVIEFVLLRQEIYELKELIFKEEMPQGGSSETPPETLEHPQNQPGTFKTSKLKEALPQYFLGFLLSAFVSYRLSSEYDVKNYCSVGRNASSGVLSFFCWINCYFPFEVLQFLSFFLALALLINSLERIRAREDQFPSIGSSNIKLGFLFKAIMLMSFIGKMLWIVSVRGFSQRIMEIMNSFWTRGFFYLVCLSLAVDCLIVIVMVLIKLRRKREQKMRKGQFGKKKALAGCISVNVVGLFLASLSQYVDLALEPNDQDGNRFN